MSQSLLASRRFAPLFWCQFFSAFNDNLLKNALVLLILFKIGGATGEALVTLAGGIFIAPFFLLSATGGELADRFDKALVARLLKLAEIGAAAVAVAGFELNSLPLLFLALFLFGLIGAFVRADQVRHPSRSSDAGRTAGRQCPCRGCHLSGDTWRHHRGGARDEERRRS